MNKLMCPLVIAVSCLFGPFTSAQKIDCGKLTISAEQVQCADQELAAAEADLKEALSAALQQYSETPPEEDTPLPKSEEREQRRYDARMRRSLLASQKAWVRYQTAACSSVAVMFEGGTITASEVPLCQAALARERANFLRDYFAEK